MPAIQQSGLDVIVTIRNALLPPQGPAAINGLTGQPVLVATYSPVGGQVPYAWSIANGVLPPNSTAVVSADTSTYTITIPTSVAGVWPFKVQCQCDG